MVCCAVKGADLAIIEILIIISDNKIKYDKKF